MKTQIDKAICVVVIGRNEGERLRNCLSSVKGFQCVYVDSGSSDNSLQVAREYGANIIELDISIPFTAARARNQGARFVIANMPFINFIQFVDGDCEIDKEWLQTARAFLDSNPQYAVACGRRRERFPNASIYNELCDLEWDTPIGDAIACGGDALIRLDAFQAVGGYNDELIAGEEPEMCFRLRQSGWKIRRLNAEMTLHDAAMTRFSQWWKRAKRAGFAYAASYDLHGRTPEQFRKKETRNIVIWGMILPAIVIFSTLIEGEMIWLVLLYAVQCIRLYQRYTSSLYPQRTAALIACSNTFAKFPQASGVLSYLVNRYQGKKAKLIEYK